MDSFNFTQVGCIHVTPFWVYAFVCVCVLRLFLFSGCRVSAFPSRVNSLWHPGSAERMIQRRVKKCRWVALNTSAEIDADYIHHVASDHINLNPAVEERVREREGRFGEFIRLFITATALRLLKINRASLSKQQWFVPRGNFDELLRRIWASNCLCAVEKVRFTFEPQGSSSYSSAASPLCDEESISAE